MDINQTLQKAILAHKKGEVQKAEKLYRIILNVDPKHPDANHNLGLLAVSFNKIQVGLSLLQIAVSENPKKEQFWISYIKALIKEKKFDDAKNLLKKASKNNLSRSNFNILERKIFSAINDLLIPQEKVNVFFKHLKIEDYDKAENSAISITKEFPNHPLGWKLLLSIFKKNGDLRKMLDACQKIIIIDPKDIETMHIQASILYNLQKYNESEKVFKRILSLDPDFHIDYFIFANTLVETGSFKESEIFYNKTLSINPNFAEAYYNLGALKRKLNKPEEAESLYRRAVKLKPNFADAHYNLGIIYKKQGKLNEAVISFNKTINIRSDYENAYIELGLVYRQLYRYEDAEKLFKKVLVTNSNSIPAHNNLAIVLRDLGKFEEAETTLKKAIDLSPNTIELYNNIASTYRNQNKIKIAEKYYRKALKIDPNSSSVLSNMLFLQSSNSYDPSKHLEEAINYGKIVSNLVKNPFSEWKCKKNPKKLRIGFVSGDFNNHPVGFFLESMLEKLHQSSVEIFAYSSNALEDSVTAAIKPFFSSWKAIHHLNDDEAAKLIHNDGVHILIDLSGHTGRNRLPMFAWKPAPVQVTWLGYWATTGIKEIDYIIGDPYRTPKSEFNHFTEKVWSLPKTSLCFTEPDAEIDVAPLPALSNQFITFGCFNSLEKLTDDVVAIRAKILKAVPSSKLFLKSSELTEDIGIRSIYDRFKDYNIEKDRLILEGNSSRYKYLQSYNRVDIALSPHPYGGVTTATEGLWMGVPVLAKKGDRYISHVSESINHNAGLSDWLASSDDEYIAKAIEFSSDLEKLKNLRENLRSQVLSSPLFDSKQFSKDILDGLWGMFKEQESLKL